jgi:hypothetical protein
MHGSPERNGNSGSPCTVFRLSLLPFDEGRPLEEFCHNQHQHSKGLFSMSQPVNDALQQQPLNPASVFALCVCRLQADIDWTCAGHLRRWGRIPQVPPVLLLPPLLHSHRVHAAAGGLPAAAAAAGSGPPGAQSNPCMIATATAYSMQGKQVLVPSAAATRQRLLPFVMHTTPAGNDERCWFVKGAVSYLRANTLYCLPVLGSVTLKLLVAFLPALEVCVLQRGARLSARTHAFQSSCYSWDK